jgi:hypothetical protein
MLTRPHRLLRSTRVAGARPTPGNRGGLALAVAMVLWMATVSSCAFLVDEDADSFVSQAFLQGGWRIESLRFVAGETLYTGENRSAGNPETVKTLVGFAQFAGQRGDIQYSVEVVVGTDPPDSTNYVLVGEFELERATMWVTQDVTGEVVRVGIRKDGAFILEGDRVLDNFSLFDGDGNESLWVRR